LSCRRCLPSCESWYSRTTLSLKPTACVCGACAGGDDDVQCRRGRGSAVVSGLGEHPRLCTHTHTHAHMHTRRQTHALAWPRTPAKCLLSWEAVMAVTPPCRELTTVKKQQEGRRPCSAALLSPPAAALVCDVEGGLSVTRAARSSACWRATRSCSGSSGICGRGWRAAVGGPRRPGVRRGACEARSRWRVHRGSQGAQRAACAACTACAACAACAACQQHAHQACAAVATHCWCAPAVLHGLQPGPGTCHTHMSHVTGTHGGGAA
jgi:hypothetical protein